jgi:hypothetical protein
MPLEMAATNDNPTMVATTIDKRRARRLDTDGPV